MNDIHQPVFSTKMPIIRQRLPFSEVPSVSMIKLDRGLVQRSLLYCFEKGCFSVIRYLLESGSGNARERDNEGRNGLMYCCFIESDSWAQTISMTLLEYGAKIEDQDQRGLNALQYAIITQRSVLVRRYLASLDFNFNYSTDIYGNTCLHYACSTGNADIVRLILNAMKRYSIDLSIKNHSGLTSYDIACQLNHDRCQNLIRNEITLRERNNPPASKTNVSRVTIQPLSDRRMSIPIRPITSTSNYTASVASVPVFISSSTNLRKRRQSTLTFNNENVVYPPPIFIDPIESRTMTLKRNASLDTSLANQIKSRSDFAPSPLVSESAVFTSSSNTWRNDLSKIVNHIQTYETPSYRKTVHPPLNNELSCELFEHLYGMDGADGHECNTHRPLSSHRPSSSLPPGSSQKVVHLRRGSVASIKAINRMKK